MEKFCGSDLWDSQISWNTTSPYLTSCFEETFLVWLPTAFIIIFAAFDIFNGWARKNQRTCGYLAELKHSWNAMSTIKVVLIIALIIASATQMSLVYYSTNLRSPVEQSRTLAPVAKIVSYIIVLSLFLLTKCAGISSSGVQSLFWLAALSSEILLLRTAVSKFGDNSSESNIIYIFRFISFPLVGLQFILHFWADTVPDQRLRNKLHGPCPEKTASFFSKILYIWYESVAWQGYRTSLTYSDLWDLNSNETSKTQTALFRKYWDKEQVNAAIKKRKTRVLLVLFQTCWPSFVMGGLLKLATDLFALASPEILKLLIGFFANENVETWKGYLYASALLLSVMVQAVLSTQYNRRMLLIGMRFRTMLSNAIYKKALSLCNHAKQDSSVGEILNLMSVDTQRCMDLMPYIHMIWAAPIKIVISLYFLYNLLGLSVFAGLAVMLLMMPINGFIAAKVRDLQMKQMDLKDNRVKLMCEILSGIKILKLYAWEKSFEEQIRTTRGKEILLLRKIMFLNASTIFAFTCAPFIVALATFSTYVYTDEKNILTSERTFVSLSLLNIMRVPLTMFPTVIALTIQTMVSVTRLNKFLNSEEIDPCAVSHELNENDPIVIENGTFSWNKESVVLRNINLRIKSGSLVVIVGTVGSGKSSLLMAMLGELEKTKGRVNIAAKSTKAYVAQDPWIQNASVRDNILFRDAYSHTNYNRVVDACSLAHDFKIFPAGDETEIGEKGINLSGGQKQRLTLARAAYKNTDVYLLDDPLSAVDPHVGKNIFDSLIGPNGLLKDKTRVFVTHGTSFLPNADMIVLMKDGMISEMGTYRELLQKRGDFASFVLKHLGDSNSDSIYSKNIQKLDEIVCNEEVKKNLFTDGKNLLRRPSYKKDRILTQSTEIVPELDIKSKDELIGCEKLETGAIERNVYLEYVKGCGLMSFVIAIGFNVLFQALSTYSNIWLAEWSDETTEETKTGTQNYHTTAKYLGVYGGLGLAQGIALLLGAVGLGLNCLTSGEKFHERMLERIIRAPMWFFDTTPIGRLLNRFSKDVDIADNTIPNNLRVSFQNIFGVIATVIVISYSTIHFVLFIIPVGIIYFFLQRFYTSTSRQLKRLEAISRSPIYSQFGETIAGAKTIRAFGLQNDFVETVEQKIDFNQKTYYPYLIANLWIGLRLEVLGGFVVFASALFAIFGRNSISPGISGLSLSYALQITQLLSFLVRTMSDLESNVVSIERMIETTGIPQEPSWNRIPGSPAEWPTAGKLEFRGYETKYREGLQLVIRGITCSIQPQEKIGIVGRTGAGKSSLTLALFRIVEPAGGLILIDGVDVTSLGLHDLRSKITIIPQDPILFSGSLRGNLDPFHIYSDDQLWKCLELAHLKAFVKTFPEGLDHVVAEEGQNYSVGQRQLVCLARALLRKTKVLILDEATAAIDLDTDFIIQNTIKSEFKYSTVLTIAHRLNTIMDSTRVLVLEDGLIKEFDSPRTLLENTQSAFYSMAKDAKMV